MKSSDIQFWLSFRFCAFIWSCDLAALSSYCYSHVPATRTDDLAPWTADMHQVESMEFDLCPPPMDLYSELYVCLSMISFLILDILTWELLSKVRVDKGRGKIYWWTFEDLQFISVSCRSWAVSSRMVASLPRRVLLLYHHLSFIDSCQEFREWMDPINSLKLSHLRSKDVIHSLQSRNSTNG